MEPLRLINIKGCCHITNAETCSNMKHVGKCKKKTFVKTLGRDVVDLLPRDQTIITQIAWEVIVKVVVSFRSEATCTDYHVRQYVRKYLCWSEMTAF